MINKVFDFPVKWFTDNLIFTNNNEVWAVYQLSGIPYDFESTDNKFAALNNIARLIANMGKEGKIYIIPVAQNILFHYEDLKKKLDKDDELYEESYKHLDTIETKLLKKLEEDVSNDYEIYISIKLEVSENEMTFGEMLAEPGKNFTNFMTNSTETISKSKLKSSKRESRQALTNIQKRMRAEAVTVETLQWLIKRPFYRGQLEVPLNVNYDGSMWNPRVMTEEKNGDKQYIPNKHEIMALNSEVIYDATRKNNYITVLNSEGKKSYQAFLGMSFIPDGIEFPNGEWLLKLQDYEVATEVCISIKNIDYDKAMKKIERNRAEIKGQIKHVAENDDEIPEELFESRESSDELKNELKQFNDPLTETTITFCIADTDVDSLENKVTEIRNAYKDIEFTLERGFPDQKTFFWQFLFGTPNMSPYVLRLPPKTLAGSMFPVIKVLGDGEGQYIGTTGANQKGVFLDPANAPKHDRSASMAFLGTLGGGKSFNANLLLYLSVMMGGRGLIIDPKGERKYWEEFMPELQGNISVTTLSNTEEDRGKLDPFIIHRPKENATNEEIDQAKNDAVELALNMLCELYGIKSQTKEYIVLAEVLEKVKNMHQPSMIKLVKVLMETPETDELYDTAYMLSRMMRATMKIGMSSLIFGRGNEAGLSFDKRVNIIQVQNIQMPEPETPKSDYSNVERLSTVLMLPITSFAKKFSLSERNRFKIVILDESWVLLRTQMGKSLYSFLARMGRSLNTGAIFIGHSAKDVADEGITAAITYKFCFRVSEKKEAVRTLEFLGLEPTDDNINILLNLNNGQCLFKDLAGNIDLLQFDAVQQHLFDAFDTNPTRQKEKRKKKEG